MCKYEKFKVLVNNRKEYDLVLDKFGKDIFEKSRKEAEKLFKKEKQ